MSESARSLEARCTFPAHKKRVGECHSPTFFCKIKKRAKRALGTGDTCRRRRILSKPGAVSSPIKNRLAPHCRTVKI
ncbi:MAG: hypothetical protein FWF77_07545 [Defluviitaleaceae bacterium]|nr:hypothetical protein [Defluviitaleaceae bacterium]